MTDLWKLEEDLNEARESLDSARDAGDDGAVEIFEKAFAEALEAFERAKRWECVNKLMKVYRAGLTTGLPREYVDYHRDLAIEALPRLPGRVVHTEDVTDGWGLDRMTVLRAVVIQKDGTASVYQWHDEHDEGAWFRETGAGQVRTDY